MKAERERELVGTSNPARSFADNLPLINGVIAAVARRSGLSATETDDFRSVMYVKLIADDYAVLRAFKGRSSFRTYLVVVCRRALLDVRTREWGKWRPSVRSRRSGAAMVLLERLVVRDGMAVDEAVRRVVQESGASPGALLAFARDLQPRPGRRQAAEVPCEDVADVAPQPDQQVLRHELRAPALAVTAAMKRCVNALPREDRLILHARFWAGTTVADIARATRIPQRNLYVRLDRILRGLRSDLAKNGCAEIGKGLAVEQTWRDALS